MLLSHPGLGTTYSHCGRDELAGYQLAQRLASGANLKIAVCSTGSSLISGSPTASSLVMGLIDTDVLLLAFAFQQDPRQSTNRAFLQQVQTDVPAITIYTLMEFLGKLSFNLSPERLEQWPEWLAAAYQLTVLWPVSPDTAVVYHTWQDELFARPFARIKTVKMPYMDALILNLAEQAAASYFITWNARHFQDKSSLPVSTPADYLLNQPHSP